MRFPINLTFTQIRRKKQIQRYLRQLLRRSSDLLLVRRTVRRRTHCCNRSVSLSTRNELITARVREKYVRGLLHDRTDIVNNFTQVTGYELLRDTLA